MKIIILDAIKRDNLTIGKEYDVIGKILDKDDYFYLVKNDMGEKIYVHEFIADEV